MYATDNAEDLSRLPHYLPLESYLQYSEKRSGGA